MSDFAPTFLNLPMEIRLQIYANLYPSWHSPPPPSDCSGISSVCHQVREETFPFVLQIPRYFGTAERLWRWTSRGDQRHLDLISDISVNFYVDTMSKFWLLKHTPIDINDGLVLHSGEWWESRYLKAVRPIIVKPASVWRSIFKAIKTVVNILKLAFIKTTEEVRKSAVVSTWKTFSSLTNLRKLGIDFQVPIPFAMNRDPLLYPSLVDSIIEQQLILEMISVACPTLQTLIMANSSERLNLSCLTNFHNLRHLSFNGKFGNSPEETLQILRSLRHLDSLTLVRLPPNRDLWSIQTNFFVTPDMIEKMNPLRSLSLMYLAHQTPSDFLSAPMLQALANHKDTLRSLAIDIFCCVDGHLVERLLAFISTSYLTKITIMLRIPKNFACLDVQSYFPATIQKRHARFVAPKRRDIESYPWISEIMILDMRGTS
ncbi:hypothetical protein N431DRAFT_495852 [Stipitochalara longipes BDJ]|nr:hypothetical protein N431DRAFT_495852 [Stipitochalara longipes BDJ]